jgi:ATP-dependent DNA ligase
MAKRLSRQSADPHLPEWIAPMLAASADEPFDSSDHLFEVKWDGTRTIAFADASGLRLLNRRRTEMREIYPELAALLRLPSGTILDGEIVVLETGRPSFTALMKREFLANPADIKIATKRSPATYVAFDLLYESGESIMDEPLINRKHRLAQLVRDLNDPRIVNSEWITELGLTFFQEMKNHGLEGMMAKRLGSAYRPGRRSDDWLKIKVARTEEFDVLGYLPHEGGKWISSLLLGQPNDADAGWTFKGNVGSGFTERQRIELLAKMSAFPPLPIKIPGGPKGSVWKQTGKRCSVRYFEQTADGKLRAPVFKGFV